MLKKLEDWCEKVAYKHRHWYFFVCVLPLSHLVRFLNHVLHCFSKLKTSRNKNPKGGFFGILGEILSWDYLFYLPEKEPTYQFATWRWGDDYRTWNRVTAWVASNQTSLCFCSVEPPQSNSSIFIPKCILGVHSYAWGIGNRAGDERKVDPK